MKWKKRLVLMKISNYAIVVSLILSIILAVYTFYGNKVGNFVISVDGGDHSISLSKSNDILQGNYTSCTSTLLEEGLNNIRDISYSSIRENIYEGIGSKNDPKKRFLAFSFYLINTSEEALDYNLQIEMLEVRKNLDASVRVMLIEGEGESRSFYAKAEDNAENEDYLKTNTSYNITEYFDGKIVCVKNSYDFKAKAVKKYTVVVWLEGWDKDTNNSILDGSLKMSMTFSVL